MKEKNTEIWFCEDCGFHFGAPLGESEEGRCPYCGSSNIMIG